MGRNNWPPRELIQKDIENDNNYVCIDYDGRIIGAFFFNYGKDIEPTYSEITEGSWIDDSPYGVIHRLATDGSTKGVRSFA